MTIGVSSTALLISIFSAFKNDLFPFHLKVLAGDLILLESQQSPSVDLILPVTFINLGYADGVVESIFLKVTDNKGRIKRYTSLEELDDKLIYQIVYQSKSSETVVINRFLDFPIPGKQSLKKNISFAWSSNSDFTDWEVNSYTFELYLKLEQDKKWKKFAEFKHELDCKTHSSYLEQKSLYISRLLEPSIIKQVDKL
jgi:hypothetical protein